MKNLIFDFGAVLVDWDPHHLYDAYFGSGEKATWFLKNICTSEWNAQMDAGKPFREGVEELSALHPEYAREIELYFTRWIDMMGEQVEGMYDLLRDCKAKGHPLYGLTNWSAETFCQVRDVYPIFKLMDGIVVSGEEHCAKPSPKIYRILLDRYQLNPSDCVFIDDRQANLDGAKALGIEGILFTNAAELRQKLQEKFPLQ